MATVSDVSSARSVWVEFVPAWAPPTAQRHAQEVDSKLPIVYKCEHVRFISVLSAL